VGTKKTKLFTRESPQDNINASFLKPTTVEDKSMGFVSRRKKIGANHGYQNPMNHIQKFHSKNVVEITALTIPKTITIDDYIPKKIKRGN
jgi:hypothetical protein